MDTNVAASVRRPLPISLRSWIVDSDGTRYAGGLPGKHTTVCPLYLSHSSTGNLYRFCRFPICFSRLGFAVKRRPDQCWYMGLAGASLSLLQRDASALRSRFLSSSLVGVTEML